MLDIKQLLEEAREAKKKGNYLDSCLLFRKVIHLKPSIDNTVKRELSDVLILLSQDYAKEAFKMCDELSTDGDILASGRLARYYRDGIGCDRNIDKSISLYRLGCEIHPWMKKELVEELLENSNFKEVKEINNIDKMFDKQEQEFINSKLNISDCVLFCSLDIPKDSRVDINLYCDGSVVERKFIVGSNCSFNLSKCGIYRVNGKIRNSNKCFESKNIQYYTPKEINEYHLFKQSKVENYNFDYYYLNYPFNDFIMSNMEVNNLDNNLSLYRFGVNNIYTTSKIIEVENTSRKILLSGYYHDRDSLIYGENDLNEKCDKCLNNKVGCFDSISINENDNSIILNTDVFGLSKIYYYSNGEIYVATNRYHLLVIFLSRLGISLDFDQAKISCMLSTSYGMLTDQYADNNCILSSTYLLPVDHQIIIDYDGNFAIEKLNNLKMEKNELGEQSYFEMLQKTRSELINNLNSYINSKHFSTYFSDLTGGVDSRLVFSLLSLNPSNSQNISLLSGGAIRDVNCAQSIASRFNYKYGKQLAKFTNDKFSETITGLNAKEYTNLLLSYDLGTSFDHSTLFYPKKLNNVLRITGCAGEVCTRPYMSKRFFNIPKNCTKNDLLNIYYQNIANYVCLSSERVNEMLTTTFCNVNDSNIQEECENFLINRTRYHFDPHLKISFSDAVAVPLLTINGFKTLRSTLTQYDSYQFVFDLLNSINKDVASCEYESFKDNVSLALFSDDNERMKCCDTCLSEDYRSFSKDTDATYVMKNGRTVNSSELRKEDPGLTNYWCSQMENLLKIIIQSGIINDQDGIDLWHLIKNCQRNSFKYTSQIIIGMFKKFASIVVIHSLMKGTLNPFEFKKYNVKTYDYNNDKFYEV